MENTPNLKLPYIIAAQAQKHVTHNEAIRMLDMLTQISVKSRQLNIPPAAPDEGACYLVAANSTDEWSNQFEKLACFQDGEWMFLPPKSGFTAWIEDEQNLLIYDGAKWVTTSDNLDSLGINATADATNRLAVRSDASLFDSNDNGHQLKINKTEQDDTASLLFQTDYSGRAEFRSILPQS